MERKIKYDLKEKHLDKVDRKESVFITYLKKEGLCGPEILSQLQLPEKAEPDSFWTDFGYKYIGALLHTVHDVRESQKADAVWQRFSSEKDKRNFIIRELLFLYFGNWDSHCYDTKQAKTRERICAEITKGVRLFESRIYEKPFLEAYMRAVENYLKNGITPKERIKIRELLCLHCKGEKRFVYPLTIDGTYTIGVVNPWPGDRSAEAEVLSRMKAAAEDIGLGYVMLDNFAHILDENTQKPTADQVDPHALEFVITTHYDSEKTVDAFYYHTLWNPPEIPLNLPDYDTRVTNNYLMNDDYLIYDFGGMSNHLKGILMNKPRTLADASQLTASFPASKILPPRLENPKLFYCGMNWEKVVSNSNRHEGLFQLLDKTGKVKFFGPDRVQAWGGLRPWEGYRCYQYSIPFDGFSILKEINDCGICLVLSSDIHRRAGAATNRTYEACAAGAVIISDDNEFMQYYFKDAALFIEYNKNNPQDTFDQIMERYEWIVEHKAEALELARRAQEIFKRVFSLDRQFLKIVNRHFKRTQVIECDLFAQTEDGVVLVSYIVNTQDCQEAKHQLSKVITNIQNQYYSNLVLGIVCDRKIERELEAYVETLIHAYRIVSMELYDRKGCRQYTDGQAIGILRNRILHDYWIHMLSHEIWFYDHITTLVRTIQDEEALCAYAGRQHKDKCGYSRADFFDNMHISTIYAMNHPDWLPVPGQMLFKSACHAFVPDYLLECLDGYEHYAYLGLIRIKHKKKIAFSKRMTSCWCAQDIDERNTVLKAEYQIRFIRDLLRFDIPDGGLAGNAAQGRESIRQYMLGIPVRAWLHIKYLNMLMRNMNKLHLPKKNIQKKYDEQIAKFMRW